MQKNIWCATSCLRVESVSRRRIFGFSRQQFGGKAKHIDQHLNVCANFATGSLTICAPQFNTQISLHILASHSGEVDSQAIQLSFSKVARSRLSAQYL